MENDCCRVCNWKDCCSSSKPNDVEWAQERYSSTQLEIQRRPPQDSPKTDTEAEPIQRADHNAEIISREKQLLDYALEEYCDYW